MKNTLENKAKFFAQYWGQEVLFHNNLNQNLIIHGYNLFNLPLEEYFLELKPLSSISDEDAIEVAKICHQCEGNWDIDRRGSDIFLESHRGTGIHYGIRIGTFYHGDISAWWRFDKDEKKQSTHTINIGKINITDTRPIPYIAVVDYLRLKGYALPWNGITVEEQVEFDWVKLKED